MRILKKNLTILMIFLIFVTLLSPLNAVSANKVKVLVGFKGKVNRALVENVGGKVNRSYKIVSAVAAEVPEAAVSRLANNPKIAYVEPDIEVKALADILPWGINRVDAEIVHPYNRGTGVKVAILDTGIDYTHPDLSTNYKGGYDFINNDTDPKDDNGHGTHCAGIATAELDGAGVVGVAPEAYLYGVKVLGATGSGLISQIVAGIDWSVANGMDVVSMSLGSTLPSLTLEAACNNAYNAGVLLIAAAGNSGAPTGSATTTVNYPARYTSVIAVSATSSVDLIATFSSRGPEVELAAPGVSVYSTLPTYNVTLTPTYGLSYGTLSGTSMACPHVTGVAALAMVAYPAYTNAQIRTLLQTTADDLGLVGRDTLYGYGLVDANEAAPNIVPDITPPVISGVAVSNVGATSATITWTTDEPSNSTVNYGTTSALGSTVSNTTLVTAHSITLTGLTPETTYYFEAKSADATGNAATDNNGGLYYAFTTTSAPLNAIHVASITMSTTSYKLKGRTYVYATALATIVDQNGNPVTGATVSGHWSGLTTDVDTGITGVTGQVALSSNAILLTSGTFTFTVDDVVLTDWTYDSAANLETSDFISI
ncbi:MAG TPA: subtilisin [Actinobacteria bacterium]|nr:subtilisin [Actinomycetota bacterium]